MAESFQRDGVWWNQQADGSWLRWDEAARQWTPSPTPPPASPPPAPPAPPPGAAVTTPLPSPGATQPLGTPSPLGSGVTPPATGGPSATPAYHAAGAAPSSIEVLAPSRGTGGGLFQNRALLAIVAIVLVGALGFAGITLLGGDGADTAAPDFVPPDVAPVVEERAEFIAKADAICAQLNAASAALPQPKNRKQLIDRIRKGRAISIAAIKRLRALDYPPADRPVIRQLFALSDRGLANLTKGLRAAQRGDQRTFVRATRRSLALGQRYNTIATDYGFKECNKDA